VGEDLPKHVVRQPGKAVSGHRHQGRAACASLERAPVCLVFIRAQSTCKFTIASTITWIRGGQ
jgi:hypothetical protein